MARKSIWALSKRRAESVPDYSRKVDRLSCYRARM